ncbi:structural protein [Bacillus phage P59]|nr:structural protein [Bacillus phage P59]
MATSGSISMIVGSKQRHKLSVEWSASQDISGNKSTITAKMYWESTSSYGTISSSATKSGSIYIDGTWYDFSGAGLASLSGVQKKLIATKSKTVSHAANGEKDIVIDGWFNPDVTYSGQSFGTQSLAAKTFSLNTIPRKSSLTDTTPSFTAGSDFNIGISRASSTFSHKAYIDVLDYNGTWQYIKMVQFSSSQTSLSSSFSTSEKTEIFQRLGGRSSATFRINLHTYSGSTSLGYNTYTGTVTIPNLTVVSSVNGEAGASNRAYVDQSITVGLTRYDSEFTHTLSIISAGSFSKTITGVGYTTTFTLNSTEQSQLYTDIGPNSTAVDGNIRVYTYYNGQQVGTYKDYDFDFYVRPSTNAPTFAGTGLSYSDINAATTAVTGNNSLIIQNKSSLRVSIPTSAKATAKNGANMAKYTVTIGSGSASANFSSTATVNVDFGAVNSATNVTATIKAEDSRGFSTSVTLPITMIAYANPVVTSTPKRRNGFEDTIEIPLSGSFSPITVSGATKNDLVPLSGQTSAAQFRYRENVSGSSWSTWKNLTVSKTGVTYTGTTGTEVLDNTKAYLFEVRVSDKLSTTTVTKSVASGKPILFVDSVKKSVGINKFPELSNSFEVEGRGHFKQPSWSRVTVEATDAGTDAEFMLTTAGGEWSIRNDDSDGNAMDFRWNNSRKMKLTTDGFLDVKLGSYRIPTGADLNDYQDAGFYYNPANVEAQQIANTPTNLAFSLLVEKHAGVRQTFTTYQSSGWVSWARNKYSSTWGPWYKTENTVSTLWAGGYMMVASQTVYPSKPLSECAHGWILSFSQYSSGSVNADWNYTLVPKGIESGYMTHNILGTVGWGINTKYLRIYDDRIVGHDGNDDAGRNTAVLRAVYEF